MTRSPRPRRAVTVDDERLAARCTKGHIAVIDDDPEVLSALAALIAMEGYACNTYGSAQAYLHELAQDNPVFPGPRCVLSDIRMPDVDGLALQGRLADRRDTPLLMMSGARSVEDTVLAFRAGALDFLIKPIDADWLLSAIRKALDLSTEQQRQNHRESDLSSRLAQLTAREREVAGRVAHGLTNAMIATELSIALRTVKFHRQRAMEKLQADSTAELVRLAHEGGLVAR